MSRFILSNMSTYILQMSSASSFVWLLSFMVVHFAEGHVVHRWRENVVFQYGMRVLPPFRSWAPYKFASGNVHQKMILDVVHRLTVDFICEASAGAKAFKQ